MGPSTARAGEWLTVPVIHARCGQLGVVLGTADGRDLCAVSFADILDEAAQTGYQRPCDRRHAQDFSRYIEQPGASLFVGLSFCPFAELSRKLAIMREALGVRHASHRLSHILCSPKVGKPSLARVDCQHRLEMMSESGVPLTFQCFLGLSPHQEMRIFNVINGKAKGLSSSLLDYHHTLLEDVARANPELYIAKNLNDDPASVWHNRLKLGGAATQGRQRRVTLRGLKHAVALFLQSALLQDVSLTVQYEIVRAFWGAVANTWPEPWREPRRHLLTKGIGVQGLSLLAGDIVKLALATGEPLTLSTFEHYLDSISSQNWTNTGPLKGFGGRSGAQEVHKRLAHQLLTARAMTLSQSG